MGLELDSANALSLYRYSRILNINPVHLSTAGNINITSGSLLFPLDGTGRYYQHRNYFQSEHVSRQEIIEEINFAESQVEDFLGTFVVPKWITAEKHDLAKHYNPLVGYNVYNVRNNRVKFLPKWGEFISGGQRATSVLEEDATVTYSDPDADGFDELATITFTLDSTSRSLYEVKFYHAGHGGEPQFEIRPPLSLSNVDVDGTVTFETWKLIDPNIYERYPTNDTNRIIDLTDSDNLVDTIDIYLVYNDTTEDHATFYYVTSANQLEDTTQSGYIKIADPEINTIQVIPADYDTDDAAWEKASICGTLRNLELNYLSGFRYRPSHNTNFWDELHPDLAQAIAYIATSRMSRPLAGKTDTTALSHMLQRNLATASRGEYSFTSQEVLNNPFGTHMGEVYAYNRLMKFQHRFLRYNNK